MTIPLIIGFRQAREKVERLRAVGERQASSETQERIRALFGEPLTPDQAVARILDDVRRRGDAAVRHWTRAIDGVELSGLLVDASEMDSAVSETPDKVRDALETAIRRIRSFHERQNARILQSSDSESGNLGLARAWLEPTASGGALGQVVHPLERVGIYVPGGSAPLPSSLLMSVIPAQVAGVKDLVIATPPSRAGRVAPVILAAARLVGVERVFSIGGAQAIGALAYGTETVPRVDKIVGAGGLFTTIAKRQVFGVVGIDGLYGPTETVLIADDCANPSFVAADLLAQAEHDVLATSLLFTDSLALAERVKSEIERQLIGLSRRQVIERSFADQGALMVVDDLEQAVELANLFAAEHLCLLTREPWLLVPKIRNAGGVFVGEQSSEALGDYVLGPSHVMPTGGTARFASPLNVYDFVRITSIFHASAEEARMLSEAGIVLATAEELTAHANSLALRRGQEEGE